jgi:hypothetical protein
VPDQPDTLDQLPQGDLRLLDAPAAQELLASAIPARVAYVTATGAPRIVPTWFHWDGQRIVMATWVAGPHVQHRARRLDDLAQRPGVTISIDTDDQPPRALQIRGLATVEHLDGIVDEYRIAAERYLGVDAARGYVAAFDHVPVTMARISVRPEWVGLLDFQTRLPGPLGGTTGGHRG